ncbi:hypothetical protein ACF0H5_006963 [Mactra antiquata]
MIGHFTLFVTMVTMSAAFMEDDPCSIFVYPEGHDRVREVTVPNGCVNGTFIWDNPRKTVNLHFPNPNHREKSVCIHNAMLGNIFTVRDVTHTFGFPMIIGDKESCTFKYHEMITLRIDAPEEQYYVGALRYRVVSY